jgi:hypothetical protein
MPQIRKAQLINGKHISLRNANVSDAKFILDLRLEPIKSRFLSPTSPSLLDQQKWMKSYEQKNDQAYFIIQTKNHEPLGCIRIYNTLEDSFEWGSWLIVSGAPPFVALESVLLVYQFALDLGFKKSIISVRQTNKTVWKFHENIFNACLTNETAKYRFYEVDAKSIFYALNKHSKLLDSYSCIY